MYEATIIEDSISHDSIRLTTMHVRYPRIIHSELMTHRVFSRNARSSRAVPTITLAAEDIFIPHFMKNKPGMQSTEELDPLTMEEFQGEWEQLASICQQQAASWAKRGMHKQWANRCLEWFGYIDVLITSTWWENFWELRCDGGAQPEMTHIANKMYDIMDNSIPKRLDIGQWHLPYVTREERVEHNIDLQKKLSTARCARLSYRPFDGNSDIEAEIKRYENLIVNRPVHASPAEHQTSPDIKDPGGEWISPELHGNFYGWVQYRKFLPMEAVMEDYK